MPTQIHHINGSKNQDSHKNTIGLCYFHHMADQQQPKTKNYVSRHPYKKQFEAEYGTEQELLEYQNRLIEEYGN